MITIGKYDLDMSKDGSYLRITLNSGEAQGEGGRFLIDHNLEKIIEQFYNENF